MELRDFPLAWRWTDPRHALLPEPVLAQITPLEPTRAEAHWEASSAAVAEGGLDERRFSLAELRTGDVDEEAVSAWLLERIRDPDATVVCSWDRRLAVETTWGIFTRYWSDFCYPASDDVIVRPESDDWILLYHHEERFQLGRPL